jgi:hypothetical protein
LLKTTSSCLFKKPQIGDAPVPIFFVGFQFMRMKKQGGSSYLRNLKGLAAFMKEPVVDKPVVIKGGYLILLKNPSMVLGYVRTGSLI